MNFSSVVDFLKKLKPDQGSVLGIDIGTSSIKVVQIRKEKERAVLETYGEISTGPYSDLSVGQAVKLPEDIIVGAIKDVVRESNVTARKSSIAIPLRSSFVTVINIPRFTDNISDVIRMEAKKYIPLPATEVNLDWWILPEEGKKDKATNQKKNFSQVLLVAIHKDIINNYQEVISRTGLEAQAYELESFSALRSCLGKESSPVAVLDFGASSTKLAIVDYGIMKASHSIGKGSQDLTLALSHSLGVDFGKAEELKRDIGLSNLPEHKEMVSVMEPILYYVFSEANALIKDFQRKNQRTVSKVILTGGGSLMKGLVDFSVKNLTIAAELAEPFNKVEYPVFLSNVLRETGANFAVALGVALRVL